MFELKTFKNPEGVFAHLQRLAVTIQTGSDSAIIDHISALKSAPMFQKKQAQSMLGKLAKVIHGETPYAIFAEKGNEKLPFVAFSSLPAVTCPGAGRAPFSAEWHDSPTPPAPAADIPTQDSVLAMLADSLNKSADYLERRRGVLVGHNHVVRTGGGLYYLPDGAHMAGAQKDARGRAHGVTPYAYEAAHYTPEGARQMAAAIRDGTGAPSAAVNSITAARDDIARLSAMLARLKVLRDATPATLGAATPEDDAAEDDAAEDDAAESGDICEACNGSGEGRRDGTTCPMCHGSGEH